jgi:hypothetical protein
MAARTVDKPRAQKFEVSRHPTYNPDLAPSDFHLFGPLKEHLHGHKFANDEVMEAVQSQLKVMPKRSFFFLEGIRKLMDRWTKCAAEQGDMSKNKTQTISISTLVNKVIIKFLFFNDFHNIIIQRLPTMS